MFEKIKKALNPAFMSYVEKMDIEKTVSISKQDVLKLFSLIHDAEISILHELGVFKQVIYSSGKELSVLSDDISQGLFFSKKCQLELTNVNTFFFRWKNEQSFTLLFENPLASTIHSQLTISVDIPTKRSIYFTYGQK